MLYRIICFSLISLLLSLIFGSTSITEEKNHPDRADFIQLTRLERQRELVNNWLNSQPSACLTHTTLKLYVLHSPLTLTRMQCGELGRSCHPYLVLLIKMFSLVFLLKNLFYLFSCLFDIVHTLPALYATTGLINVTLQKKI